MADSLFIVFYVPIRILPIIYPSSNHTQEFTGTELFGLETDKWENIVEKAGRLSNPICTNWKGPSNEIDLAFDDMNGWLQA